MGLDMYLEGHTYVFNDWNNPENNPTEDGFRLKGKIFELGYWRKHPGLHGFIVQTFAGGKDECQDIDLGKEEIQLIIEAVKSNKLPNTSGFFFGQMRDPDDQDTIKQLRGALAWLEKRNKNESRAIVYRASW